jgi:DNA-binding NarL/FixJ family response regulator
MIRVIIADDHVIFRQGLLKLLSAENNLSVIGEAGDGAEALNLIMRERPDIAIVDISMPGLDGFEIFRKIRELNIGTKVIFLTMHKDSMTARKAMGLEVSGYVLKDNAFEDLLYAIRSVYAGGTFVSPSVSQRIFKQSLYLDSESRALTARESEILRLIATGLTNRQIGDKLCISVKTVETHRTNIMQKLDLHSTADLVRYAMKTGLVDKE